MKSDGKILYASALRSPAIAKIIKELRSARLVQGATQGDVARKTGIPRSSISMWEAGTSQPHLAALEAWATALGYTLTIDIE